MGKAKRHKSSKPLAHPYSKARRKQPAVITHNRAKPSFPQAPKTQELPFQPEDRILLVGEGDFSFAVSLSTHHNCTSLTATTLETRSVLDQKHPQAVAHISTLESDSHTVLYSIDATKLGHAHAPGAAVLRRSQFDVVIFNFPHVGGRSTDVNRQVRANQELVVRFLENSKVLLASGGRILLTIFEGQPYELWGVRNLARHVGLRVERSMQFEADMYPSYRHARTFGNVDGGGGWKGEQRKARMFVFVNEGLEGGTDGLKQKNSDDSDDDDDNDDET